MIRINKRLALAASLTAVVVGLASGVAFAAGDSDDNTSPTSTKVTADNSTNIIFRGTVGGQSVTVTCKNSSILAASPT